MELVLFYVRPEFVSTRVDPSSSREGRDSEGKSERNGERDSDKETGNIVCFVLPSSMPEKVPR